MPDVAPAADRRAALKARSRRAIVDAAASLMDERSGTDFTVDELADRADVSRRTIFNHFASTDDIVSTVCTEVLDAAMSTLQPGALGRHGAPTATPFDELADALRSVDLIRPMAYLTRVLGRDERAAHQFSATFMTAMTELSERLSDEIAARHPDADLLTVNLLVSALLGGILVVHHHWAEATGGVDDDDSRRVFAQLLAQLIASTGAGYARPATLPASRPDPRPLPLA